MVWRLTQETKLANSTISDTLTELIASVFVGKTKFLDKKTQAALFSAVDFFSCFHHKWIAPHRQ